MILLVTKAGELEADLDAYRETLGGLRPPKYSERSMEAYWRGREDEARIREELDGAPVDFEPTEKALEFPPPAEHDFANCRTPGHRSCAARRAWVTMRSKGIKPGGST